MKRREYRKDKTSKLVEEMSQEEFFEKFPDNESAIQYFEDAIWSGTPECPKCHGKISYNIGNKLNYRCGTKGCRSNFNYKTGTIFQRSKLSPRQWLIALRSMFLHRKGISSIVLSIEMNVTQTTAYYVLRRIRNACITRSDEFGKLKETVEVDETFVGGKERNKHADKKIRAGRGSAGKTILAGAFSRNGGIRLEELPDTSKESLHRFVTKNIEVGSNLMTDEGRGYFGLDNLYNHRTVNHSRGQYVDGDAHVNTVESGWAVFDRSHYGTYHHMSPEYIFLYASEFAYRLTEGSRLIDINDRMYSLIRRCKNKTFTREEMRAMGPYANNSEYAHAKETKSKKQREFMAKQKLSKTERLHV